MKFLGRLGARLAAISMELPAKPPMERAVATASAAANRRSDRIIADCVATWQTTIVSFIFVSQAKPTDVIQVLRIRRPIAAFILLVFTSYSVGPISTSH